MQIQIEPQFEYFWKCETCGIKAVSHMTALQARLHKRVYKNHRIVLTVGGK